MIAVLLWMLIIFISSAQPANRSKQLSNRVIRIVIETVEKIVPNRTTDINIGRLHHLIRKNAHFFSYLVLGVLVVTVIRTSGTRGTKGILIAFAICVIYAISDEIHQAFVPGRGPQIRDVFIDSAGSAAGIGFYWFVGKIVKR
ncbi:VanZ family protein [Alkaliphilus sp. B6464]|nr:VanZ family protein [Alkaliphilus sp. B6464]